MKQAVHKSPIPASRVFVVKSLEEGHFDPVWHAHDEYQLFLVANGSGTRFIGNTMKPFGNGDCTLLGPQVPHLWRNDSAYFDKNKKLGTHGFVIYFKEDCLQDILHKEEMGAIKKLFETAKRGIDYKPRIIPEVRAFMEKLVNAHGTQSIILFLQLLEKLAHTRDYELLHQADYAYNLKESATHRINLVYNYAAQHFHEPIALNEVAKLLNMTSTSFSRYFKIKTSKSFSDFLAELRIKHACKLLVEDDLTIHQISMECGYNTLSNFNRQFKLVMKTTPKAYREEFATL